MLFAEPCPCCKDIVKVEMCLLTKAGTCHNCLLSLNSSACSPLPEFCHGAEEFPSLGSTHSHSHCCSCAARGAGAACSWHWDGSMVQQSSVWAAASVMVGAEKREFYYSPEIRIFFMNLSREDWIWNLKKKTHIFRIELIQSISMPILGWDKCIAEMHIPFFWMQM